MAPTGSVVGPAGGDPAAAVQPTPPPTPMAPAGSVVGPAGGDPAAAYAQLMAMIQPKPPVPMAGQGGTGLTC